MNGETQHSDSPQAEWERLARAAADSDEPTADIDEIVQLLSFELDNAPYAVPVEDVREIVRMRPITPVPRVPESVRGVISLRGEIIEVVDICRRLDLKPIELNRRTRIIVVNLGSGQAAAILVDAVKEVLRVPRESIRQSAASDCGAIESRCSVGDRFVSFIELDRVLAIHA
jgi:purine-binding chemotaxis protein CheW